MHGPIYVKDVKFGETGTTVWIVGRFNGLIQKVRKENKGGKEDGGEYGMIMSK